MALESLVVRTRSSREQAGKVDVLVGRKLLAVVENQAAAVTFAEARYWPGVRILDSSAAALKVWEVRRGRTLAAKKPRGIPRDRAAASRKAWATRHANRPAAPAREPKAIHYSPTWYAERDAAIVQLVDGARLAGIRGPIVYVAGLSGLSRQRVADIVHERDAARAAQTPVVRTVAQRTQAPAAQKAAA